MEKEISLDDESWKEISPNGEPVIMNGTDGNLYQAHINTVGTKVENLGVMHTTVLIYKNRYEIKTNMHCQIIKDIFTVVDNVIHIDLEFSARYDIFNLLNPKMVLLNDSVAHVTFSMGGFSSSTHGASIRSKMGNICIIHHALFNISNNMCTMKLKADYTLPEPN